MQKVKWMHIIQKQFFFFFVMHIIQKRFFFFVIKKHIYMPKKPNLDPWNATKSYVISKKLIIITLKDIKYTCYGLAFIHIYNNHEVILVII